MAVVIKTSISEASAAAKAAGLRYVSDSSPGIRRRRCGKGFTYLAPTVGASATAGS